MTAKALPCTCTPGEACDPACPFCSALDREWPCPADPATYDADIEDLMDRVKDWRGFEGVVVCADGSEPFASLDCGHGLVLDLTAKLKRVEPLGRRPPTAALASRPTSAPAGAGTSGTDPGRGESPRPRRKR